MPAKPDILESRVVAQSRLFKIEALTLRFENGALRTYERLLGLSRPAVMVVPVLKDDTVLLVREYGAGIHGYHLGLPKGLLDAGETETEAANRELMEEVGYGARRLTLLQRLAISPGYMGGHMRLVLAQGLYEERRAGDEPEEIEVVPWRLSQLEALWARDEVLDARSIAALYIVRDRLQSTLT